MDAKTFLAAPAGVTAKLFHLQFYAIKQDGEYRVGSIWVMHPDGSRLQYCVHDGTQARLPTTPLFDPKGGK